MEYYNNTFLSQLGPDLEHIRSVLKRSPDSLASIHFLNDGITLTLSPLKRQHSKQIADVSSPTKKASIDIEKCISQSNAICIQDTRQIQAPKKYCSRKLAFD